MCSQPLYKPIFLLRHHASHQHQLGLVCFLSRVLNLCMSESSFPDLNLCMSESSFSDTMHPINSVLSVSCHVFSTSAWVNHHSQTSVSVWVNDHSQTSCIPSSRSCWCPVACSQPLSERSFPSQTCIPSSRSCWWPVTCSQPLYEATIFLRKRAQAHRRRTQTTRSR